MDQIEMEHRLRNLQKRVEFQDKQIVLLIQTVHKLMDAVKTFDTEPTTWNDPFADVFAGVSELEFNHGIEE